MILNRTAAMLNATLRALAIASALLCLGGCISTAILPLDSKIIAITEIDANEESVFAEARTEGVAVTTKERRDRVAINFFDLDLKPRWRAEVKGTDGERISVFWIDATEDLVSALVHVEEPRSDVRRVELRRYNIRSGEPADSFVVISRLEQPEGRFISALRVAGDRDGSPVLYRLHYRGREAPDRFDSVGLELFTVEPGGGAVTGAWARIALPRPYTVTAEVDRFGLYGLELERDGRLYALSLAEKGRVVLYRIDPASGRVDTISIHRAGFDTPTRELSSLVGAIKPVGQDVVFTVMANKEQRSLENDPPLTLMARVNFDAQRVERVVHTRLEAGLERGTDGMIAGLADESPIFVLAQLESRAAVERLVWLDGIVVIHDDAFAPLFVDRFQDFLGHRGVTSLFISEARASVLYKEGKLGVNKDEVLTRRIYNTIRGRVESTQRLIETDMWMLDGGTMALTSGELIVGLTNGSREYLVRLQPAGALRIAPTLEE